jgi:hypothetical protein
MLITVCRLYDSYVDANRVVLLLEAAGLPPSETTLIFLTLEEPHTARPCSVRWRFISTSSIFSCCCFNY